MSEETIKQILKDLGLTDKEGEMYVFLAKHGALRSGEITKLIKMDKAEVYRVLTNLQTKGLVEKTLESPTRFISTPFERAIDSFIKYKRDEANLVERTKKDLIRDWNQITKTRQTLPFERFIVIEGRRKIYPRISEMIKETKKELSIASTVTGYLRAEEFGVLDEILNNPLKTKIDFRFLTKIKDNDSKLIQKFFKKIPKDITNIEIKTPDLPSKLLSSMILKDREELLLFIHSLPEEESIENDNAGLWTNCKTIVQSFALMFEDLWHNSTNIQSFSQDSIKFQPEIEVINNYELAEKKFFEAMQTAKEEILLMSSSETAKKCSKILEECSKRGISVKFMVPIVENNFKEIKILSKNFSIKHIPMTNEDAAIIDNKESFQFNSLLNDFSSKKTNLYSKNLTYIKKLKDSLNEIWQKATPATDTTLESTIGLNPYAQSSNEKFDRIVSVDEDEKISEKEIVQKIIGAKRRPVKDVSKDFHVMYASGGSAIVHPPKSFNLPDLLFQIHHIDKSSGFGQADAITVFLWMQTPNGYKFVPAGGLGDNKQGVAFRKSQYTGFPAEQNHRLVRRDELQVRIHGNTLFAGWTVPIPLLPPKYILQPSCLQIEGYGNVVTKAYTNTMPSGFKNKIELNGFHAFVTYMHPESKYSGPGTDGFFIRDLIMTMTPPQKNSSLSSRTSNF